MVSNKEMADAFQAAAAFCGVREKELGQLLAFLASNPGEYRDFFPIGAGNEIVVEFVRAAYRDKASIRAAASSSSGPINPEATSMMEALRNMKTLPRSGGVLKLGENASFLFAPDFGSLYVRKCYRLLCDKLMLGSMPGSKPGSKQRKFIVTGTPGIGKSWFVYYFLARLLKSPQPPPYIVLEHLTARGKAWCYTHATGKVVVGDCMDFSDAHNNPLTWYITDGVPPQLTSKAHILLLTSPKRVTYKEMDKEGAEILYMPLWTLDELLECRRRLYNTMDEAFVKELYRHFGGTARYVLQGPTGTSELKLDELLDELHQAVASCNTAQVREAIESISTAPESSHRMLHIVADENFKLQRVTFASKWVADQFVKKVERDDYKQFISLMFLMEGAAKGMIFEALMHAVLAKGGRFTVVPVDMYTLERGDEEELELDACQDTQFFKDGPVDARRGVYSRPSISNYPAVDSFLLGMGALYFFQMTIREDRAPDADKLSAMLDKIPPPQGVTPWLLNLVPEETFLSFKLTAGKKWPPKAGQKAASLKLYIMKGVYARLQGSGAGYAARRRYLVRR